MRRRHFLKAVLVGSGVVGSGVLPAVRAAASLDDGLAITAWNGTPLLAQAREPIIDVHMHAYPADMAFSDPLPNPANGRPPGVANGEAHRQACLAEMKRLNIVKGVVSGGDGDRIAAALHWRGADRDRFIAGAGIRGSAEIPLPEIAVLRTAFTEGGLGVLDN